MHALHVLRADSLCSNDAVIGRIETELDNVANLGLDAVGLYRPSASSRNPQAYTFLRWTAYLIEVPSLRHIHIVYRPVPVLRSRRASTLSRVVRPILRTSQLCIRRTRSERRSRY